MENNNNQYWKGLDELHLDPEFEKHRYNEFAEKLAATVKSKLICGDGFSPSSTLGPLINEQGLNKVLPSLLLVDIYY